MDLQLETWPSLGALEYSLGLAPPLVLLLLLLLLLLLKCVCSLPG
jgi:hypothetical protein